MVEVIQTLATNHCPASAYGGGAPLIHIHSIERHIHGNSCSVRVYAEIKMAAGERVWAFEVGLKSIEVMVLTPEVPLNNGLGYMAQKYIHHKGEFNNYASIDIYDDASAWQSAGTGPTDGSIWLDAIIKGE